MQISNRHFHLMNASVILRYLFFFKLSVRPISISGLFQKWLDWPKGTFINGADWKYSSLVRPVACPLALWGLRSLDSVLERQFEIGKVQLVVHLVEPIPDISTWLLASASVIDVTDCFVEHVLGALVVFSRVALRQEWFRHADVFAYPATFLAKNTLFLSTSRTSLTRLVRRFF